MFRTAITSFVGGAAVSFMVYSQTRPLIRPIETIDASSVFENTKEENSFISTYDELLRLDNLIPVRKHNYLHHERNHDIQGVRTLVVVGSCEKKSRSFGEI